MIKMRLPPIVERRIDIAQTGSLDIFYVQTTRRFARAFIKEALKHLFAITAPLEALE